MSLDILARLASRSNGPRLQQGPEGPESLPSDSTETFQLHQFHRRRRGTPPLFPEHSLPQGWVTMYLCIPTAKR